MKSRKISVALFTASLALLLLVGCGGQGKNDGNSSANRGNGPGIQTDRRHQTDTPPTPASNPAENPTANQSTGYPAAYDQSGGYYYSTYEFSENGCTTGYQEFKGATPEAAQEQLCNALASDSYNQNCADILRQQLYAKVCSTNDSGNQSAAQNGTQAPSF